MINQSFHFMVNTYIKVALSGVVLLLSIYCYISSELCEVNVTRGSFEGRRIAYIGVKGSYTKAWYNYYNNLTALLNQMNYPVLAETLPNIGIYYEDPQNVGTEDDLRCIIGLFIDDDWKYDENLKSEKLHFGNIETMNDAIIVKFPQRSLLSIFTAIRKVYPEIRNYAEKHLPSEKLTAIAEVYLLEKGKMIFVQGIGDHKGLMTEKPETFEF
ncbi:hypothetical protein TRFO_16260 [Tritrichomonas foetus]|uniref:GyrI-like small molecule binding domain-containing protein n=1 Tax=Tritrichomonas foetus TaxID=1144522 RepID=A0A1J4KQJ1_9EUKA|nr:hypothetical protein TRFO_16260 [Tritrichomonas foetus]|eukprot:OHT13507.1 hypothetical protein TRFO_16260 [Tritrichomonas foetus]